MSRTLQMALDALDNLGSMSDKDVTPYAWRAAKAEAACTALREALAAPQAEPVAWYYVEDPWGANEWHFMTDSPESQECDPRDWTPLYAAPPAAPAPAAPVPDGMVPNAGEVICPNCAHQFRAIPENVQSLLLASGHEPPFTASPAAPVPDGWVMVPREPTPEMIAAYLAANTQYWAEVDALPRTPVTKWRQGTPSDATRESYRAMIAAHGITGGSNG